MFMHLLSKVLVVIRKKKFFGCTYPLREWINKQQTVERFKADLKTVPLFNITEHSVF